MIKIGKYQSEAIVYNDPNGGFNFSVGYEDLKTIRAAFAASNTIEFSRGNESVTLYNPELIVMHIRGDILTVLFAAATIPPDKTAELEEQNLNLITKNAELEAALADATETIGAMGDAIAELGEIVGEING